MTSSTARVTVTRRGQTGAFGRPGEGGAQHDTGRVSRQRQAAVGGQPAVPLADGDAEQRQVSRDDAAEHLPQPKKAHRVQRARAQRQDDNQRIPVTRPARRQPGPFQQLASLHWIIEL
jgi:hypothetical protein